MRRFTPPRATGRILVKGNICYPYAAFGSHKALLEALILAGGLEVSCHTAQSVFLRLGRSHLSKALKH